mmetsp:Transcript_47166/g.112247  ORF Transcript_47166/g.112247 Transcript_47166/m.112247 type:complete len:152 (-) Transcript_47166:953-1408(-)
MLSVQGGCLQHTNSTFQRAWRLAGLQKVQTKKSRDPHQSTGLRILPWLRMAFGNAGGAPSEPPRCAPPCLVCHILRSLYSAAAAAATAGTVVSRLPRMLAKAFPSHSLNVKPPTPLFAVAPPKVESARGFTIKSAGGCQNMTSDCRAEPSS